MPRGKYRIPKDEQILEALERVFEKRRVVNSQRGLKQLVEKELDSKKKYGVGEVRIRHLTIGIPWLEMEIHYRESAEKRAPYKCPVCKSKLKKVRNLTVFGGTVTLGFKCETCGYSSGLKRRIPIRYVFTRRK
jgi:prepilin signal peptidase PulO-like enzyme (type II secretory pathway)